MLYIVKNCPAREDIFDYDIDENGNICRQKIDTPDYCVKHKKTCDKVDNCITKWIIKNCKNKQYDMTKDNYVHRQKAFAQRILKSWQVEEVNDNAGQV